MYSPVSYVPRIRIHGPVNAETVCFWRIVIVVAECQSSPLAWWRCIWERHACISIGSRIVVHRCADARGGGIGSTRGSPSESGTFHCRTRGGRIAIVLSLSIQLLLIRSWKTFSSFPAEGNFVLLRLGSSRAEHRSLSRDALIRTSNASYSRITGTGWILLVPWLSSRKVGFINSPLARTIRQSVFCAYQRKWRWIKLWGGQITVKRNVEPIVSWSFYFSRDSSYSRFYTRYCIFCKRVIIYSNEARVFFSFPYSVYSIEFRNWDYASKDALTNNGYTSVCFDRSTFLSFLQTQPCRYV